MLKKLLSSTIEGAYNIADRAHTGRLRRFYKDQSIDLVIDIGSHKGEFINLVIPSKEIPIYSFEPQAQVREKLLSNTADANVLEYFDCALSNYTGEVDLYLNNLTSTTSLNASSSNSSWIKLKTFLLGGSLYQGKQKVRVEKLDDILFDKLDKNANVLIKIDVEGAEAEVLQGAQKILEYCNVVFVQTERANYDIYDGADGEASGKESVASILKSYGLRQSKAFLFPLLNFTDVIYSRADDGQSH